MFIVACSIWIYRSISKYLFDELFKKRCVLFSLYSITAVARVGINNTVVALHSKVSNAVLVWTQNLNCRYFQIETINDFFWCCLDI